MARFTGQASSVNPVRRIAIATAKGADDVDMPLLINALGASGISAEAIEWDADRNWHAFDMVLVRSTWDYPWRVENFSAWIDHVSHSTLLVNPSEVIRWNLNKCYLCDLDRAGLPVIPTRYIKRGERPELPAGEIVVKPVVSASAWNTARYLPDAQAETIEHIRMLHSQGVDAMVQPYLKQIEVMGERRLIFFNNRFEPCGAQGRCPAHQPNSQRAAAPSSAHPLLAEPLGARHRCGGIARSARNLQSAALRPGRPGARQHRRATDHGARADRTEPVLNHRAGRR